MSLKSAKSSPLKTHPATLWWKVGGVLLLLTAGSWFLYYLRDVFSALLTAFALAYIFNPLINKMEHHGAKRSRAVLLLLLLVVIILTAFSLFVVPLIVRQISDFVAVLPTQLHRLYGSLDLYLSSQLGYQLPQSGAEVFDQLRSYVEENHREIIKPLAWLLSHTFSNVFDVVVFMLNLLIIPMLMFYLLVDFHAIKANLKDLIPRHYLNSVKTQLANLNDILASFFRGQLGLIFFMAIFYSCGFLIVGVPLGLIIGTVSGLGHLIPYLGPLLSAVLGLIMILTDVSNVWQFVGFFTVIGLAQFLESFILTPRLVGKRLGLSPVTTIIALLIFGKLLGFLGVLLAIPLAAVSKIFLHQAMERYKASNFYRAAP